jgi:hypothetical protein
MMCSGCRKTRQTPHMEGNCQYTEHKTRCSPPYCGLGGGLTVTYCEINNTECWAETSTALEYTIRKSKKIGKG